jgi:predicted MPP superfamily phosphohydrolase
MVFITGDLITDHNDPLYACLVELKRLRSGTGIWGCMGNHEMYSRCQNYTKQQAALMGMDFLRYERRVVAFGAARLNLIGVDYQKLGMQLPSVEQMVQPDTFNLLLSHTPVIFPTAAKKGVDLTLAGHTHGGQINLEVAGRNINLVDLVTPYTKGLYRNGHSAVYVNSGLGTIGVPMRIGAPPEITVIRLCNS